MIEIILERGLVVIVSSEVPDENAPALGADQLRYLAESVVAHSSSADPTGSVRRCLATAGLSAPDRNGATTDKATGLARA